MIRWGSQQTRTYYFDSLSIALISSSLSLKSKILKFSTILSWFTDFGKTTNWCSKAHRRQIWATDFWYFTASPKRVWFLSNFLSPLARGDKKLLKNHTLFGLAVKYQKSVAQICLRWALEHQFVVLPKSVNQDRIVENFNIFDFKLSEEDMRAIDRLSK